ncbi:type I pullulanase [uncultured Bacteroides sp.]|uniref:type I pullulanase n=1 Tax=uncultured Bacteroides sp. TaxID=162156 RepID=UPI0023C4FC4B|nr:type I pullulanase [uncultured Bacteroides sp.]MDE6171882.1 type I pullulanase [Bacteroides sp.]
MNLNELALIGVAAATVTGCTPTKKEYTSYELYPVRSGSLTEMEYTPEATHFTLWAPTADEVRLMLFDAGEGGHAYETISMIPDTEGTWTAKVEKDLLGKFYTFNVKINERWLGDTPGINAKAVGVNGKRAAILDMRTTDPEGWADDKRPALASPADAVIYEMHHRDFSVDLSSGIRNKGKYLALTEEGTLSPEQLATGIDHLKELGVTHVHILPSYDYASVDETKLDENRYNWGYDPQNYNVPDGSYSTDPYDPAVRIREFKQMVQALHKAGIRVVLDVVYNHTFNTTESNFERTVPGYFYRQMSDGSFADGSACGNETASNRPMMRKYMKESVLYWLNEYHLDGFRFDLMGIHDIATMNEIRKAVTAVDPSIIIYGEGWAAKAPQMPEDSLAMKANIYRMPGIAAFSDEMRDALRGPFNDNRQGAFLAGIPGGEESIKFGIVGAVKHPQVDNDSVNYSKASWAEQPTQMISYVSCHDDMCLVDRLKASVPGITPQELARLDKLAQTAVFTSQGIPFIYAGEEVMRDKKGVHNSYNSPDSINAIDWKRKAEHADVFAYYKGLIQLRKNHPAFRMGDAGLVRKHLEFLPVEGSNLIAYRLKENANGDAWEDIIVVLNSRKENARLIVPEGKYTVVCKDGFISEGGLGTLYGPEVIVPVQSALIIWK